MKKNPFLVVAFFVLVALNLILAVGLPFLLKSGNESLIYVMLLIQRLILIPLTSLVLILIIIKRFSKKD
jgi:hypothetical protein